MSSTAGRYWVLLADPKEYGWPDLVREGSTWWDGIRNARAQGYLRQCERGDLALIYHTAPDKALMGVAGVSEEATPDPRAPDRVVIRVVPVQPLERPLPLAELRQDELLREMGFVRMPRVAVQPLSAAQWARVLEASGTRPSAGADWLTPAAAPRRAPAR